MANASDWATAAGGIPIGLIEGYNYGQKAQREEEKALEDIKQAKTLNELLGYKAGEYMSPEQAATRASQNKYTGSLAELGLFQTGAQLEAGQAERPTLVGGLQTQIRTAATGAATAEKKAGLESELFGKRARRRRAANSVRPSRRCARGERRRCRAEPSTRSGSRLKQESPASRFTTCSTGRGSRHHPGRSR
jgi:hypothetical protein